MRISSLHTSSAMLRSINNNSIALNKTMEQMSQKKRVLVPSDDPIASTRLVQLSREQAAIGQYKSNITAVSGSLAQQETHMDAINKQLLSLRDKLLTASNATNTAKDMDGYASEMQAMLDSVVAELNTKSEDGRYIFSGTKTGVQTVVFDEASGKYVFQGNNSQRETTVANGIDIKENTTVGDVFFDGSHDLLNDLNSLVGKLKDPNTDFSSEEFSDAMKNMIDTVDDAYDAVSSKVTELGGRQNTLTMLGDAHTDVATSNELVQKDLSELDYAEASIKLKGYMVAMEATQATYVQITRLSLFDAI
ncbi:Hook-filament junction protein [Pragia fontium]|uniref:Flagellar hook-associated protein 3 n=1 Tax=Pragia fontium TaxID=82985 RepID=A0ABQ5LHA3_9GAMM|nr:flagellar hook-associated protein FlgL [Pragia fontium]AKJ41392.1 hypothetical protein QQ39_04300 [Pragia fontium]GKX62949.1 flagellar hook-associated protein 3 [Pragia fontium]SUB81642.1 Hook-filament junction protein [Pragia fontium]